jgi:cellulose synthase (UDP-forming)
VPHAEAIEQRLLVRSAVEIGLRRAILRTLATGVFALGAFYLTWRCVASINLRFWWFAIPLVAAETYSCIDTCLFALTVWKLRERGAAPRAPEGLTVDVFVTRYNEPVELLRRTARAARAISYPHRTYVLDDGDSAEVESMAVAEGVDYITRGDEWNGRPRHAKAGNLSNALMRTEGEFILVLDADQVSMPEILDRTLGYFGDPKVALVQTPQFFSNVPRGDPFGSQAPLFYGPIQQGKDGWNAAFFCGSNAVLRRDALMQVGVAAYVSELTANVRRVLRAADRVLSRTARRASRAGDERTAAALRDLQQAVTAAERARRRGDPIQQLTYRFQRQAQEVSRRLVAEDLSQIRSDITWIREAAPGLERGAFTSSSEGDRALTVLAGRDWSPLGAVEAVASLLRAVDVDRADEAQPVLPLSTISVTEDMATALRLHARGWTSVYEAETLALGLAPEDLGSAFQQRLRWAQGTIQVLLRENPLLVAGLSPGQRLMYLATMWSYLSGVFALVYIAGPPLYLLFGVTPVSAYSPAFFSHLVPYLLGSQVLFLVAGWGKPTWRGQQYSLSLFPLWIQAAWSAFANVVLKRELQFKVTPKVAQVGSHLRLVWAQLLAMAVLGLSVGVGVVRLVWGMDPNRVAILANLFWACYLLVVLSVIVGAMRYRPAGQDATQEAAAES